MKIFNTILSVILLIAVIFLFVKIYGDEPEQKNTTVTEENIEEGQFSNLSIAYINMDTLNEKYSYQDEMRLKLEERYKKMEQDIANRSRVLQEDVNILRQQAANLNQQQLEQAQRELMAKEQQLQMYSEQKTNELAAEQEEMNRMIFEDLEVVLKKIREEYDLDFILRRDIGGPVLSAGEGFDITDIVVRQLNENYEARKQETKAETE